MKQGTRYLGLDVHGETIAAALAEGRTPAQCAVRLARPSASPAVVPRHRAARVFRDSHAFKFASQPDRELS